ncbi:Spt20 family-domain-containing protein [Tricladium varicosporioides]|nr:Spt20 family-domain-containing protein [Hymenoscyphus varicosporioides]
MSAGRLPNSGKPSSSAVGNSATSTSSGIRSASRVRRETPSQLLGRGQRNSSVGLRSASIVGESAVPQTVEPTPYIKTDEYILKKYRNSKPSLIVHLHATHFRFDQQEGSFSYKSPMKCLIEHLKKRTIPHELVEFMEVPYYEGCMIVQIHNHKAATPSQEVAKKTGGPKTTPFSVHNYNTFLTPSPYVPYPTQGKDVENDPPGKPKTAEQKDQENMPAPSLPGAVQSAKSAQKVKISTIVLHPTPLSEHMGLAHEISQVGANNEDRRDSRVDGGPLSATVPPTPTTGIPPTPSAIMAPPAKRVKKTKVELDATNIHAAEAQITLTTTAGLVLDPVSNAAESAALLRSLAHPMHSEKPPSPKTRKRTVAEMAADEALAAEQERYMLILDERLSSNAVNAQGGGNPADGDGQAGGASFEPRFERFKTLENIKAQHEENKRNEQIRQQEAERKAAQDREREAMRLKNDKAEADKQRQLASQAAARQQEITRRQQLAAQQAAAQQSGIPPQLQNQHGHPQANSAMVGGNLANANRFHQQVSQAAASSPIVRNGTPQSHSSPMVNNMGNVPMQTSTSSMGGSPPRPGSVVHQNQPQMGAPGSHPMATQRSQQSHAGTPRMPNSTPIPQNTPLNRQMNQTPRMSQASPIQGPMAQAHGTPIMMQNGQMMTPAQAQQLRQQQQVQQLMRQSQQNAAAQGLGVMSNGQPINAQQQAMLQAQLIQRQQQQQGIPVPGSQLAQGYANHMANMAQRGMQPGMNPNFVNNSNMQQMNMQQLQLQQQMQMRQAQVQQQQQAAAQAQAQAQVRQQQPQNMQQQYQQMVRTQAAAFYRDRMPNLQAQHPGGIPPEIDHAFRIQCQNEAQQMVTQRFRANQQQRIQAQAQMMAQAGMQQNMSGMQNGMGM